MSDDLVERARTYGKLSARPLPSWARSTFTTCADRIEAQEVEIRSLREQVAQDRAGTYAGMPVQVSRVTPDNEVWFRHSDGRVDKITLQPKEPT